MKKVNVWKLAFLELSKTLNLLMILSILFIIIYQIQKICESFNFIFISFDPIRFEILNSISDFISILSYAIITSYIFYYITHQLPLIHKRIRIAEFFCNSVPFIQTPLVDLEFDIFKNTVNLTNKNEYNSYCEKIKLDNPVRPNLANCISWEKFIVSTLEKTILKIDETHNLSDLMNSEIFILLQHIKSDCITAINLLSLRERSLRDDKDNLSYLSGLLYSIREKLVILGIETKNFIFIYSGENKFKSSI